MNRTQQLASLSFATLLCACQPNTENGTADSTASSASTAATTNTTPVQIDGFSVQLSGDANAELTGSGIYRLVRPRNRRGSTSYHYLTDGNDADDYNIVFILPLDTHIGTHTLHAPNPSASGSVHEAQINSKTTGSFSYNTQGTLTVEQVQIEDPKHVHIAGHFNFHSDNTQGQRIHVQGRVNFNNLVNDTNE